MDKSAFMCALAAFVTLASCGKGDRSVAGKDAGATTGICRLRTERVALIVTSHHSQNTLLTVAEVTAMERGFGSISEGSDSAKVVLYLSSGTVLKSPMMGSPRYIPGRSKDPPFRTAVWRWAWHSMTDTSLKLSDSSATVDSSIALARWRNASGLQYEIGASGTDVDVSRNTRRID